MNRSFLTAIVVALGLGLALPAVAIDLDQARSSGVVGERPDGLIGPVTANPPADVKALIDSVNAARLAEYKAIAAKNGTPLDAVQAVAGEKQIQKARENKWYVMSAGGGWSK